VIGAFILKSPLKDDLHVNAPITSFYSTLTLIHIGLKQTTVRLSAPSKRVQRVKREHGRHGRGI